MEERSVVTVASGRMPETVSSGGGGGGRPDAGAALGARAGSPADRRAAAMDGRTRQQSLLLMVPITPGKDVLLSLEDLLREIANTPEEDSGGHPVIPFGKVAGVHFARILIHYASEGPPTPKGQRPIPAPIPNKLLFATDFDGTLKDHLFDLIDVASDGLDRLFGHCEGWPELGRRDRSLGYTLFAEFVMRHGVVSNTFYTGTMKRSVSQIRREAALRDAIEGYLDAHVGRPGFPKNAVGIRESLRTWIFSEPRFDWVYQRPGAFPTMLLPAATTDQLKRSLGVTSLVVTAMLILVLRFAVPLSWIAAILVGLGPIVLAGVAFLTARRYLRFLEARDPVIISDGAQKKAGALVAAEDRLVQNQISTVSYIKRPLWFRRPVLKTVLALINLSAKYQDTQGTLSGIPSIHFARWVVVDSGQRLLFFSNFDGSWESYLGDFVDKAKEGLTAIWSNCVGFPRTVGLFKGGAGDEQRFKALARDSQVATHVWYSAYPALTVSNINDNTRLRLGLYGEMNETAARAWLRMAAPRKKVELVARPSPERPQLELDDVQGLVSRSYPKLTAAAYLPVIFPSDDPGEVRSWLAEVIDDGLTPATRSNEQVAAAGSAMNIAFMYAGLQILGVDRRGVVGFSREFTEGMAGTDHRQRLLGDTGDAAPSKWHWGGRTWPVHAMLFVFAGDTTELKVLVDAERTRATAHGLTIAPQLDTVWLTDDKEHFGFHDGIAQPDIAGFGRDSVPRVSTSPEVPAGEVVLGYPNAYGFIPLSPTVPEDAISAKHLKETAPDPAGLAKPRDLGRNGSYVVFRQLQQDVKGFWKDIHERAPIDPDLRKQLAAKMVGRWPNGAPLVSYPDAEPHCFDRQTANAFWYRDDLEGESCPIGAHIRRTNPRDGLHPNTHESLVVADRHRLLRRGRAYGQPIAESFDPDEILSTPDPLDGRRGLHFICFNTDISRQFEFVQQTWMNSGKFDGLHGDPDAIVASRGAERGGNFTVQQCPVRRRHTDLKQFVKTVGGVYLFMPGFSALRYLIDDCRTGNRSSRD